MNDQQGTRAAVAASGFDEFLGGVHRGELASDNFTTLANLVLRDPKITFGAKGLFGNIASHRKGFQITEEFLATQGKDGVKKVRTLLAELRENGYLYRGPRSRYPAGTVNAKGVSIAGALGPYTWYVTDKPAEIAAILTRVAQEQQAAADAEPADDAGASGDNAAESAGGDYRPDGEVGTTSDSPNGADAKDDSDLGAESAGSPDQGESDVSAGRNYLPKPTGGFGRTKKTNHKKTKREEDQVPACGGTAAASGVDRLTGDDQPGDDNGAAVGRVTTRGAGGRARGAGGSSSAGTGTKSRSAGKRAGQDRGRVRPTAVMVDVAGDLVTLAKSLAVVLECQGASPLDALDMASKWCGKVLDRRDAEFCEEVDAYGREHDVDQAAALDAVWEQRVRDLFEHSASTGPDAPLPHARDKQPVRLRFVGSGTATAATG